MSKSTGPAGQGPCPGCGVFIGPMPLGGVIAEYEDGSKLYECKPEFDCATCGHHITEFLVYVGGNVFVKFELSVKTST